MTLPEGTNPLIQGPADERLGYWPGLITQRPITLRIFENAPNVWWRAFAVAAVLVAVQVIYYLQTDFFESLPEDPPLTVWFEVIHAFLIGYILAGTELVRRGFACNLRQLNAKLDEPVLPESLMNVHWPGRVLVVLLIAVPLSVFVVLPLSGMDVHRAAIYLMWVRLPLVLIAISVSVFDILVLTRRFAAVVAERLQVDVLNLTGLEPIARFAMRAALYLAVGTAVSTPMLIDTRATVQTASLLMILMVAALCCLLPPVLAARRVIRAEKEKQDQLIGAEIAGAINNAGKEDDKRLQQAALAGLFAWRGDVRSAREWVFSAETNLRFVLLALVPIASWIMGGIVENLVGQMMGG